VSVENKMFWYVKMYTTLLADDTDTFFEAPRLIGYLVAPRRKREFFSDGITTSGVTVGNSLTDGFIELLPTGSQASYVIRNDEGQLNFIQKNNSVEDIFLSVSSTGDLTLSPLQITNDNTDTVELVPILADQNGKLYRGHSLFQTIATLTQRITALEAAGSVQVEQRLGSVEQLANRLKDRHNALNLESTKL